VSRVIVHAHFPTDVAAGAMLGAAWAWMCHQSAFAPVFARTERLVNTFSERLGFGPVFAAHNPTNRNSSSLSSESSNSDSDQRTAA
jgi:hypothetical protein